MTVLHDRSEILECVRDLWVVDPVEHLFGDYVSFRTYSSLKEAHSLEHGQADFAISKSSECFLSCLLDKLPEFSLRRQEIACSSDCLRFRENRLLGLTH